MSGVSSIPSMEGVFLDRRDEEIERREQAASQPLPEEPSPQAVKAKVQKTEENTTLQAFQYTGKGSFIDKVF